MAMTMTEKILARHAGKTSVRPGENIWVDVDVLMTHDVCGPGTIEIFKERFGADAKVWDPDRVVIIPDHYIFTAESICHRNVQILRDFVKEQGGEPPDYVKPIWDDYMAFHLSRDAGRRHQKLHESHYSYLDPEEARFITPEMIKTFCIAGQPEEIAEQLGALERQGLNAVNFIAPLGQQYRLMEDFAEKVIALMR